MRIAVVSVHTSPLDMPGHGDAGGMNVFIAESSAALVRRGHKVEIFTRATSADDVGTVILANGVKVHRLIAGPCAPMPKNDVVDVIGEFAVSMAGFGRFDVVHSHYWLSGLAVLRSEWAMPHVHTFHTTARMKALSVSAADAADSSARAEVEQEICDAVSLVSCVSCVSEADAAALQKLYRVDENRVVVATPGVDGGLFRRRGAHVRAYWRMLQRVPADAFVVTMAGRVQPLKAQDLFAEAVSRIDPSLGVVGVIIGDPTEGHEAYYARLRERVTRADLAGRVLLRRAVARDQLALWFAASQIAVVPSVTESFGLTSLEAQAAALPVIARAEGGLPETLVDGVTGMLVDSADPDVWADAIVGFVRNSPRRAAAGRAAHAFAREHSWDSVATRLEDFYSSLD